MKSEKVLVENCSVANKMIAGKLLLAGKRGRFNKEDLDPNELRNKRIRIIEEQISKPESVSVPGPELNKEKKEEAPEKKNIAKKIDKVI